MSAFSAAGLPELFQTVAEGIVDIFQLEVGVVYQLNVIENQLELSGECNLTDNFKILKLPLGSLEGDKIWNHKEQKAVTIVGSMEPPLGQLGFEKLVYMPLFNNERMVSGVIIGGITSENVHFFDFYEKELISPFMVYCYPNKEIFYLFLKTV